VGVAVGTDLVDADALVEGADRALYRAKSEGRDRLIGVDVSRDRAKTATENR
jgi:PleD family two-component response regulator